MLANFKNTTSQHKKSSLLSLKSKSKFLKAVLGIYLKNESTEPNCIDSEWPFDDGVTSVSYKVTSSDSEQGFCTALFICNRLHALGLLMSYICYWEIIIYALHF